MFLSIHTILLDTDDLRDLGDLGLRCDSDGHDCVVSGACSRGGTDLGDWPLSCKKVDSRGRPWALGPGANMAEHGLGGGPCRLRVWSRIRLGDYQIKICTHRLLQEATLTHF